MSQIEPINQKLSIRFDVLGIYIFFNLFCLFLILLAVVILKGSKGGLYVLCLLLIIYLSIPIFLTIQYFVKEAFRSLSYDKNSKKIQVKKGKSIKTFNSQDIETCILYKVDVNAFDRSFLPKKYQFIIIKFSNNEQLIITNLIIDLKLFIKELDIKYDVYSKDITFLPFAFFRYL